MFTLTLPYRPTLSGWATTPVNVDRTTLVQDEPIPCVELHILLVTKAAAADTPCPKLQEILRCFCLSLEVLKYQKKM